jgi:hypothetical protein
VLADYTLLLPVVMAHHIISDADIPEPDVIRGARNDIAVLFVPVFEAAVMLPPRER